MGSHVFLFTLQNVNKLSLTALTNVTQHTLKNVKNLNVKAYSAKCESPKGFVELELGSV